MTTHPSLRPVLTRSNVSTLVEAIRTERDDVLTAPAAASHSENRAYARGLQYAVDKILLMWASAVIAADAARQDIDERIARGDVE